MLYDIENYIPHRGKMKLIDELIETNAERAVSLVTPARESLFFSERGVSALVGIEYIAQTIAAYSCAKSNQTGAPKVGLLLGSRRYESQLDYFPIGERLTITVNPMYLDDDELGIFNGQIELQGRVVVTATLNVFQPDEISDYLKVAQ